MRYSFIFYITLGTLITSCQNQKISAVEQDLYDCWTKKNKSFDEEVEEYEKWLSQQGMINNSSEISLKQSMINIISNDTTFDFSTFEYDFANPPKFIQNQRECLNDYPKKIPKGYFNQSLVLPYLPTENSTQEIITYFQSFPPEVYSKKISKSYLIARLKNLKFNMVYDQLKTIKIQIDKTKIFLNGEPSSLAELGSQIDSLIQNLKKEYSINESDLKAELRIHPETLMGLVTDVKQVLKNRVKK